MRRTAILLVIVACSGKGKDDDVDTLDTGFTYYTQDDDDDVVGDDDDVVGDDDDDDDTTTNTCVEQWLCTPWETDGVSDDATRTCSDLNSCGTTTLKPAEAVTLPALDFDDYRCQVEPIVDRTCSQLGCHGTEAGRALRLYARGRLRVTGEIFTEPGCLSAGTQKPSEDCTGSIECVCWSIPHHPTEDRKNYDSVRGFALDNNGAVWADQNSSELLTQATVGGPPHVGVKPFQMNDADYTTILNWLGGASSGTACHTSN
jgi:hypothetical protein